MVVVVHARLATAQAVPPAGDTSVKVTFGGFVDAYYAYDFGRPAALDRRYTTQAARHNEFNVSLAYLDAVVSGKKVRGRLAFQAGTAVQANYAAEPTIGAVSGPSLSRNIQEAYGGVQVRPNVWVDAGIFYSNAGMEGWVSRDNLAYTRSLAADYSPYYSSGVRATWQATGALAVRVDVVNGWQNISETNSDKALGMRLDYAAPNGTTVSYYNFLQDEAGGRLRVFNGAGVSLRPSGSTRVVAQVDYGTQHHGADSTGFSNWYGGTAMVRYAATSTAALVVRGEFYHDADQVVVATGAGEFRVTGWSVGTDIAAAPGAMWRTELRGLAGRTAVFPDRDSATGLSKTNLVAVSSLSVSF